MRPKEAVSGRVDPKIKQKIVQVAEEKDLSKSEIVRRAVRHYVEENPDGYDTLYPNDEVARMMQAL